MTVSEKSQDSKKKLYFKKRKKWALRIKIMVTRKLKVSEKLHPLWWGVIVTCSSLPGSDESAKSWARECIGNHGYFPLQHLTSLSVCFSHFLEHSGYTNEWKFAMSLGAQSEDFCSEWTVPGPNNTEAHVSLKWLQILPYSTIYTQKASAASMFPHLYMSVFANTMLFLLICLCNIIWNHIFWDLQHCSLCT
jgi:hypothetical protein